MIAYTPDSARGEGEAIIRLQTSRGAHVVVESRLRITHDGQEYHASVTIDGRRVFERHWSSGRAEVAGKNGDGRRNMTRNIKRTRAREASPTQRKVAVR